MPNRQSGLVQQVRDGASTEDAVCPKVSSKRSWEWRKAVWWEGMWKGERAEKWNWGGKEFRILDIKPTISFIVTAMASCESFKEGGMTRAQGSFGKVTAWRVENMEQSQSIGWPFRKQSVRVADDGFLVVLMGTERCRSRRAVHEGRWWIKQGGMKTPRFLACGPGPARLRGKFDFWSWRLERPLRCWRWNIGVWRV